MTHTHTHSVGLPWTSYRFVEEISAYTAQQIEDKNINAPAGFELAIPAIERPHTYLLDRTATEIGRYKLSSNVSVDGYLRRRHGNVFN